jgi:CDP-diglyceride synthetase
MSLQDAIVDSDSPKSNAASSSAQLFSRLFRYEGSGSTKDRLLTALYILVVACVLSMAALSLPYGGLLVVAWAVVVSGMSAFEATRLFARDAETLLYRPAYGAVLFLLLALPTLAAAQVGVQEVVLHYVGWQVLLAAIAVSAQGLLILQVCEGRSDLQRASQCGASVFPAMLLVSVGAPQLIIIAGMENGVQLVWWLVAVVALNDAAAYFVGRQLGKHKLAPALSPNKSIEGSVAGLLVGSIAGVVFWKLLLGSLPLSTGGVAVVSLLAVCSAQCADLAKSYLKRLRNVKDTGALFPGHGGVLDRFDGMIGAAPVVVAAFVALGLLR